MSAAIALPRGRALAGSLLLLLNPAVYLIAEAVSAAAWRTPAYSYANNAISDLGVPSCGTLIDHPVCSPLYPVMNTAFLLQGAVIAVAAFLLAPLLASASARVYRIFAVITGVGLLLVGTFPGSPEAVADGTVAIHTAGAGMAIFGGNIAAIIVGTALHRQGHRRLGSALIGFGIVGNISVIVMFAVVAATSGGVISGVAIAERISVYTIMAAQLAAGIALLTRLRRTSVPIVLAAHG
ncbi:DUF998 domain-containing protein [Actinoplanes couchii]|uniref:DUF998 domain-containing protein n=1 Tax=Actinoplanes couchii TaxID=403638 RepID=A0ABQ3XJE3_9ACTN|nr:DUF998 domain-containing protein [Actinoplanes couchii]MDR6324382.1 putative membrane protein [Actinoplanes couchii]GID58619.1 hypothetical protein Aco03nite_070230 [Actinoplanes couchii]